MIIEITSSGGFSGIAAAGMNKKVETESLTGSRQQELCDAFDPAALEKLAESPENPTVADGVTYTIKVRMESGETRSFELRESAMPPEMLDMIDEM